MPAKRKGADLKVQFGWRFWLPIAFLLIAMRFGGSQYSVRTFLFGLLAILFAEDSGRYIARRQLQESGQDQSVPGD